MNVARSTRVRKGYLLTALAVAVLLFASSGTAWAQSVRFDRSTGTLEESGSDAAATPAPLKVTISRSGSFDSADADNDGNPDVLFSAYNGGQLEIVTEYNGQPLVAGDGFTITARSGTAAPVNTNTGGAFAIAFGPDTSTSDDVATRIELTIEDTTPDDGDWDVEQLVLKLSSTAAFDTHVARADGVILGARQLTVRVTDDEQLPQFKFTPPGIQLAQGNTLTMRVDVGVGAGGQASLPTGAVSTRATLAARTGTREDVLLSVSPSDAVGNLLQIWKDANGNGMVDSGEGIEPDGQGNYNIGKIGDDGNVDGAVGAVGSETNDGIELSVKALDVSGFRDERITFTLMDGRTEAQMMGNGGGIEDSNPATVTLLSGEETPTVTFSTDSVTIDEGGTETVHILADTNQGDQVGSVAVSVTGDATIVLEQGGNRISGGVVDFGGSANAEVTIRALGDVTLEDGDEKMSTVTITDASGANIGDPRSVTVTVVGSTAVPVLPLVGQLILALLLTAGGARLYRRRQQ